MVRVNAAAIPDTLLEAELFGVAPGAYTGAGQKARPGKFELADGGTLFLDEVGDMPLPLQAKLLRVLQEGEIEPLGATRLKVVDVRVIAATGRDLASMVETGTFRADLFYRLNVLPLRLPSLRERREDLPILCEYLLERIAEEAAEPLRAVAPDGLERLAAYAWPGNVRELWNVLQQAAARSDGRTLVAADFPMIPPAAEVRARSAEIGLPEGPRPLREAVAEAERTEIQRALVAANGVKSHAAKLLGISRAQLYEKLTSLGLVSE